MKRQLKLLFIAVCCVLSQLRAADAPQSINYQGKLLNSSNANVSDGSYTISFKIYAAPSGSTFLWGETATVVVSSGVFNVQLGPNSGSPIAGATYTAIGDALSSTTTPYLGLTVTVDSSGPVSSPQEITPRLLFLSSAYALVSHNSHYADYATTATNAMQLNGQSPSAYFTPASTAATTFGGPITLNGGATVPSGATQTVNGTLTLSGTVNLGGTVNINGAQTYNGGFVPVGCIIIWNGSSTSIPAGYHLCDGSVPGAPDLRNRFILAAGGAYGPGAQGGSTSTTLTASMIPDHKHQYKDTIWAETNIQPQGNTGGPEGLGSGVDGGNNYDGSNGGWDVNNSLAWVYRTTFYTRSGGTSPTTSQDVVPTMPPYYALCYIIRLQ